MAQRDIAAEFGISLSAVEKHLQKAYRAIAAWQQDDGTAAMSTEGRA
jgi:RNA polymerase sigma-70 factor (ECF subfamily)